MTLLNDTRRLLSGPALDGTPERYAAHVARLGTLPVDVGQRDLIGQLEASGLLGRGGAGFPVGRKWRAIAERTATKQRAVVVANGAEGEPASHKDRVLMTHRPHLVIDGAVLAAEAIGADEIVFYIGREHEAAVASMRAAMAERKAELAKRAKLVLAPLGYVAGEATAVVNAINTGKGKPTTTPPRVSDRGVGKRPTLVQNVESLAYAALIARYGEAWYRSAGRLASKGTALITVSGAVQEAGVWEIELGTTIGEVAEEAGARQTSTRAVLLGGYFGTWASALEAWTVPLDPAALKAHGLTFGCGLIWLLPNASCGVWATAQIMEYLADASAAQCGPCLFGLRAIADANSRLASGKPTHGDLQLIERLIPQTAGRGACHHPDGAVQLMASALHVFGEDFAAHAQTGRCLVTGAAAGVR
jgi:NADH:ubiquinone oxidoreductase subunit F (NADH-binding)